MERWIAAWLVCVAMGCDAPQGERLPAEDGRGANSSETDRRAVDRGTERQSADGATMQQPQNPPAPLDSPVARKALAIHRMLSIKQLQYGPVQEDLKLREEQIQTITEMEAEGKQLFRQLLLLSPQEQGDRFLNEVVPAAERLDQVLQETLDADQLEQVRRLALEEQQDPGVFLLPHVVERLQMTDKQLAGVEALVVHCDEAAFSAGLNPLKLLRLKRMAAEARGRAFELLSDEQRQTWRAVQGAPQ